MENAGRQAHWENGLHHQGRERSQLVSGYPGAFAGLDRAGWRRSKSAIIDIGCGASRLVDGLVDQGFDDVTALDLSGAAWMLPGLGSEPAPTEFTGLRPM